jgi:hypothetical protein
VKENMYSISRISRYDANPPKRIKMGVNEKEELVFLETLSAVSPVMTQTRNQYVDGCIDKKI